MAGFAQIQCRFERLATSSRIVRSKYKNIVVISPVLLPVLDMPSQREMLKHKAVICEVGRKISNHLRSERDYWQVTGLVELLRHSRLEEPEQTRLLHGRFSWEKKTI